MRPRRCWSGRWRMFRREGRHSRRNEIVVERVIDVAAGIECIEGAAVVLVQRESQPDALRQIRIRYKVTAEGDQIGVTTFDNSPGGVRFKAPSGDDLALEYFSEPLRRDGCLALFDNHIASHAWLDDVKVGEAETV